MAPEARLARFEASPGARCPELAHVREVVLRSNQLKRGLALLALALGARVAVIAASLFLGGRGLPLYARLHDGREYMAIARAMPSPGGLRGVPGVTQRFYPGYPAVVRLVSLVLPMTLAALAVSLVAAALATLLFQQITGDEWLAAFFAVFTPSWLLYSSLAMSEGLFLALALWGFALWKDNRPRAAALVFGALTLTRPVGALVFAACWTTDFVGPRRKRCLPAALIFLILPALWMVLCAWVWGDPFRQFNAYVDKDFTAPLSALLSRTLDPDIRLAKKLLVWGTLALNAAAIVCLLKRFAEERGDETLAWLLWAAFHFVFCLVLPSDWAFGSLDRFFVASLPPMMVGLAWAFPRQWWAVGALGAAGVAVCVYWNLNMIRSFVHLFGLNL